MTGYQSFLQTAAAAYGTKPAVLQNINRFENGGRATFDVNHDDSNAAAGHPSGGPMQYIQSTFAIDARNARAANPAAWKGIPADWKNPYAQALAASYALANGQGKAWSTYDRALQAAGTKTAKGSQTTPAASSGASSGSGDAGTRDRFSDKQKAVLAAAFDSNPHMKQLLGILGHQQVDVVRPTPGAAGAVVSGAGGGPQGQQLVATALAQVGKTANDAMKYIHAAGGKGYEAWCGDFVQWVFQQRGLKPPPARSVPALMSWAAKNNKIVTNPRAGDLVTFDWNGDGKADHVELVRGTTKGGVTTVGGNTSLQGGGTGVAAKTRTSNILGYVRAA